MHIIIVLGCKTGLIKEGPYYRITENSHLYYRLFKAIEVYNDIKDPDKIIVCSGGKGEAKSMKKFLLDKGFLSSRIKCESYSISTIENCIFTYELLGNFLENEPTIQKLNGIDSLETNEFDWIKCDNNKLYLVTNEYHLKRSLLIFWYFLNRMKNKCMIEGIAAKIPDLDPKWQKKEENSLLRLSDQLYIMKNWSPTPQDYISRQ